MENSTLQKLNPAQILPVKQTEGPVLVIAGAGSGKTRVLTNRIAYLVNELNVDPRQILAITFTNKAADEMRQRLYTMVDGVEGMWICTIHSMCVRILRSCIEAIGFEKNFSIYSEDDKDRVIKRIIQEIGYDVEKYFKLAKNLISIAKNNCLSPKSFKEEYIQMPNVGIITEIYQKYEIELKKSNALDFDDLLIKTLDVLTENDDIREYYSHRFKYVHIDEFQDTNSVQYAICKHLTSHYKNIFVVGDDDQSIYGWRGAKISNILDFEKDFKNAKVYKLEQNYRSTKSILNVANLIIKNNDIRKNKTLWTDNEVGDSVEYFTGNEELDEASYVATKIKGYINNGKKASDFAVLMRINALSRSFEQEFLKYNIPYKVFGGFKFFDRKEIKDLTAYLRIINNPLDNEAILRIINVPRRGIGDKTIEVIKNKASDEGKSIFDEIMNYENLPLTPSALNRIKEFKSVIYSLIIKSGEKSVPDLIKCVIDDTEFLTQFEENTEENIDKKLNVSELINSATEYDKLNKGATLNDYLSSITLSSDTDELNEGNFVTIATIHSVKGLEFDTVFSVGLEETIFPISRAVGNKDELEEERRLMYVAITRAQNKLFITRARSRYLYGNRAITSESRFVKEVEPLLHTSENSYDYYNKYSNQFNNNRSDYGYNKNYSRPKEDAYGYYADEPSSLRSFGQVKSFSSSFKNNGAVKVSSNNNSSKFKSGMKVKHAKFGEGTIVAVKNDGKVIDVVFKGFGVKSLASEIAPIEIEK